MFIIQAGYESPLYTHLSWKALCDTKKKALKIMIQFHDSYIFRVRFSNISSYYYKADKTANIH